MKEPLFDPLALAFFGVFGLVAFAIGAIVGAVKGEGGRALLRGLEAGLLALVGGFLARSFIYLLLAAGEGTRGAALAIGWGFFLWPGAVDTLAALFDKQMLTSSASLLWIAGGVAGFAGMMDGLWQIHRWRGLGWVSFPLDMTWGLAGTTNGCLFHLVNFLWAGHANEPRHGAHRYVSGFRFKGDFAVTQGSVMSNMGRHGPRTPLHAHENTHVWQNRIFGPAFTLSYLGWMVLMFLPGLIAGAASRSVGPGGGIEKYCYFNNPWEAWGYRVGQNRGASPRAAWGPLIWPDGVVLAVSVVYFALIGLVVVLSLL